MQKCLESWYQKSQTHKQETNPLLSWLWWWRQHSSFSSGPAERFLVRVFQNNFQKYFLKQIFYWILGLYISKFRVFHGTPGTPCTVGNIDNYWLITKSRFYSNLGPKKLIFWNFGAIFSHFSNFGAKFFIHFNFSRPFGRENLIFWASKLMKINFGATILYELKSGHFAHCDLAKSYEAKFSPRRDLFRNLWSVDVIDSFDFT